MSTSVPLLTVGAPAPHFQLPSATGGSVALADFQDRSAVVLVFLRNQR